MLSGRTRTEEERKEGRIEGVGGDKKKEKETGIREKTKEER